MEASQQQAERLEVLSKPMHEKLKPRGKSTTSRATGSVKQNEYDLISHYNEKWNF